MAITHIDQVQTRGPLYAAIANDLLPFKLSPEAKQFVLDTWWPGGAVPVQDPAAQPKTTAQPGGSFTDWLKRNATYVYVGSGALVLIALLAGGRRR